VDNGKGYIEDRRPGSNIDPYVVCGMICDTALIPKNESLAEPMLEHFKNWMSDGRK
jgi:glutamine synthetase